MANRDHPLVSALFITYDRFDLLERAVYSFRENTEYSNLELVISDNGSPPEVQDKIRNLPADVFAFFPKNRGLGANNNNGIRNCSGKYSGRARQNGHVSKHAAIGASLPMERGGMR